MSFCIDFERFYNKLIVKYRDWRLIVYTLSFRPPPVVSSIPPVISTAPLSCRVFFAKIYLVVWKIIRTFALINKSN